MIKIKCENENGNIIDFSNENQYVITNIDGLNPPNSDIIVDSIPNFDGGLYRHAKMQTRNIVITFRIKKPVERNRLDAYRVFRSKRYIRVYVQTNALNVYTEGYVELIECNNFTLGQTIQVSIICPDAYFKNVNSVVAIFNQDVDALEFPFYTMEGHPVPFNNTIGDTNDGTVTIYNNGDSECGMKIIIKPKKGYQSFDIMIKNIKTGKYIFISRLITSELNEYFTINTNKGEKGIYTTYIHPVTKEEVTESIVNTCIINDFLECEPGENSFRISQAEIPEGYTDSSNEVSEDIAIIPSNGIVMGSELWNSYYKYDETKKGWVPKNSTATIKNLEMEILINERWQGV